MKIVETNIPAAYVTLDDKLYLVIGGPVIYIMIRDHKLNRFKDVEPEDNHMQELRKVAKTLWDITF